MNRLDRLDTERTGELEIASATAGDIPELAFLFDAYRVFYEAASAPAETETFLRRLIANNVTHFFLARERPAGAAIGFVHLMPSISTVAMRPIWLLEDLYVAPSARCRGVAAALMRYSEAFARATGAERLTLATAHNNHRAQSLYDKLGYIKEDHFWYCHRFID